MFTTRTFLPIYPLILAAAATACDPANGDEIVDETVDAAADEAADDEAAEAELAGNILLELELSETRKVQFVETAPGEVMIAESGHMDLDAPRLAELESAESWEGMSLAEVYLRLQPESQEVPAVLLDADERVAAARAVREFEAPREAAIAIPEPAGVNGPTERDPDQVTHRSLNDTWNWAADKLWFSDLFCKAGPSQMVTCIMEYWYGSYSGAKAGSMYFRAVGMAAGFDSTAVLYTKWKKCGGFGPWYDCAWEQHPNTYKLQPRHYQVLTWTEGPRDRWAGIDQSTDRVYLSTVWSTTSTNPPPPPEPCVVQARAHAGTCYNIDGTVSYASNTLCADACAGTYAKAEQIATAYLATQTCLGPYAGCCVYHVNQNFNYCGG